MLYADHISMKKEKKREEVFPGGPVVRTQRFQCHGPGSIPGWGTKIPQAVQNGQKKKRPVYQANK